MLCPAKINLGLEVRHRRAADGYHYINSIFLPIDFGDELLIETADEDQLHSINELPESCRADYDAVSEAGAPEKNILWRALAASAEWPRPRLALRLIKRCPTGAGLGGGSSDAGSLLRWLRDRGGISESQLRPLALQLGADVPFFLNPRPMLVSGIGDIMDKIELGRGYGVLVYSGLPTATAAAYAALKRTLRPDPPPESLSALTASARTALARSNWSALQALRNDFEPVVFAMQPELERLKAALFDSGAAYASMSGSGSALYGLAPDQATQQRMFARLRSQYPHAFVRPFSIGIGAETDAAGEFRLKT